MTSSHACVAVPPIPGELLAAIRATPDDDAPRLVYADWLLEQGGDLAHRGDYIQVACTSYRAGLEASRSRTPSAQRHASALRARLATFADDQRRWARVRLRHDEARFEWSRGFVSTLTDLVGVDDFVERAAEIFAVAPLLSTVRLRYSTDLDELAPAFVRLAALPAMAQVRRLSFSGGEGNDRWCIDRASLRALAGSTHLGCLEELELPFNAIDSNLVDDLLPVRGLPSLRALDLAHNHLGPRGAGALAASPRATSLRSLVLRSNRVRDEGVAALAASPRLSTLEALDVSDNGLSAGAVVSLLASTTLQDALRLRVHEGRLSHEDRALLRRRFKHLSTVSELDDETPTSFA